MTSDVIACRLYGEGECDCVVVCRAEEDRDVIDYCRDCGEEEGDCTCPPEDWT